MSFPFGKAEQCHGRGHIWSVWAALASLASHSLNSAEFHPMAPFSEPRCPLKCNSLGMSRPESWACGAGEENEHRLCGYRSQDATQNGFQDFGNLVIPEYKVNHRPPIQLFNSMHTQWCKGKEGTPRVLWIPGGKAGFLAHSKDGDHQFLLPRRTHTAQPIKQPPLHGILFLLFFNLGWLLTCFDQ